MTPATRATTKSGLRIANFSSPHSFTMDDGTILPACKEDRANALMLNATEATIARDGWTDIQLRFEITERLYQAVRELQLDDSVDIVLVPLPVLEAIKQANRPIGKCRVVRVKDRINKVIFSDKFCI